MYYTICSFGLMVQIKSIDNAEQLLIFKEVLQKMSYIEDMKVIGTDINNLVSKKKRERDCNVTRQCMKRLILNRVSVKDGL